MKTSIFPVLVAAVLATACSAGGAATWTYAPLGPTAAPSPSGSAAPSGSPATSGSPAPSGSAAADTIDIEETSNLQIVQNGAPITQLQLTAGQTYTFNINNTAGFTHDFYLGPADKLSTNVVDGLPGVPVNESGVQTFTFTVPTDGSAAGWEFACTVPGHYANMHGALAVSP